VEVAGAGPAEGRMPARLPPLEPAKPALVIPQRSIRQGNTVQTPCTVQQTPAQSWRITAGGQATDGLSASGLVALAMVALAVVMWCQSATAQPRRPSGAART
jgi:hypothetical protein